MQLKLHMVTIEDLVPEGHFLRKLEATLDLSFIHEEASHLYNRRYGRPAVDPAVLVKYLLVGYLYGIPSERQIEQRKYRLTRLTVRKEDILKQSSYISQRESTAAILLRISRDDGEQGESNSIQNQRKLLTKAAKDMG